MVTNIKVYLLSDYWAAGTAQLNFSFRRLRQRGRRDLTKLTTATTTAASKSNKLSKQKNNFARASRFFVHFLAVPARLQREITKF